MQTTLNGQVTLALRVADWRASADWFRDHLGFEMLYEVESIGWCELRTPSGDVSIGLSQVEHAAPNDSCVPTFTVGDIDAERSRLEGAGVRFDGPTMTIDGIARLATFFDPDGNPFMFAQSLMEA
ncbi:MAG: VOC family protein [Phycisphaerales bacterium]